MKRHAPAALGLALSLAASSALAQVVAVDPSQPPRRALTSPAVARRAPVVPMLSLRLSFGGGLALTPASGEAFQLRGTLGSRVFFPTRDGNGWIVGSDFGVDGSWGNGQHDATLLSIGSSAGHLWGLTGVGWSPRLLFGWRDGGDVVWGVRHGVRVLLAGGVFDLEVSHQYVAGDLGDEHQMQLAVGMDLGLVAYALAHVAAPR